MAHVLFRAFSSRRLQWIGEASKMLLVETNLKQGEMIKVQLPRLNKKPATLTLDPASTSIKEALEDFAYRYSTGLNLRSSEGDRLSVTTPVLDLIKEPFFIEFAGTIFGAFPTSYDPTRVPLDQEAELVAEKYMIERGLSEGTASTLAGFNAMLSVELKGKEEITMELLQVAIKKVLTSKSLQREYHEDYMLGLYNIFKTQYARELQLLAEIDQKSILSAKRWIRSFWQVLLGQFFVIQYGTFYLYSWDIMEPITCMMTMGDTCAAYFFWIASKGQSYDIGGIWQYFYQRKRAKLLRKNKLNPSEMASIQALLDKLVPNSPHS